MTHLTITNHDDEATHTEPVFTATEELLTLLFTEDAQARLEAARDLLWKGEKEKAGALAAAWGGEVVTDYVRSHAAA